MFLTEISLKRPVLATVNFVALLAVGILSFNGLTISDMPETNIPYITTTIVLPGAAPDQLETKVAKKVEEAVGQISGVKHITTTIKEGVTTSMIEFDMEKSADSAVQEVRDKLGAIRGTLPLDIEEPIIAKFDITAVPIFSLAVTGSLGKGELSQLTDDVIAKSLNTVKGVGAVNLYGNLEREIQIKLDKEKLNALGVTVSEVVNSLRSDNLDLPSGKVSNGNNEITIRTYGSIKDVQGFADILVAKRDGVEIRVRDIAEIVDGYKEQTSFSYYQDKEAIGLDVIKQSGANTVTTADAVNAELQKIQSRLPAGVNVAVVRDNSIQTRNSVNDVVRTMLEGCLLAVLIVFLFLKDGGSTAISAITLPTSIIATFIAMKMLNYSLNNMSLMGLSLAVGLLIDDAIVVIENIVRHLKMGKTPLQAAKEGTEEISLAVMATTLTVVAVFLPISFVSGIVGKFLVQFGITVVCSVLISMLVSFTLVPLLSARYVKIESGRQGFLGRFLTWFNSSFDKLADKYRGILEIAMKHLFITVSVAVVLFVASLQLVPLLGSSFQPMSDKGQIIINADLDAGLSLETARDIALQMNKELYGFTQVQKIYATIEADRLNLFVKITPKEQRQESIQQICADMRTALRKIPGVDLSVNVAAEGNSQAKQSVYHLKGENFEQLQLFAAQAKKALGQIPYAVDISTSYKAGKPEAKMAVNRDQAADLGVSTAAVGDTLRTMFNGVVVSQFEAEKDRYDVRVELKDDQRTNLSSVEGIYVPSSNQSINGPTLIPLDQLTKKEFATSSSTINRYDKTREIQISANPEGISQGDFDTLFKNKLLEIGLPPGITMQMGGESEMMQEAMLNLVIALGMGALFIFLILAAQFESYIDPLAIIFSLPLAVIGAILGLYVAGSEMSMVAMIGIILLMGLVTKNAILLIDFIKQQRAEGVERELAILQAAFVRLRPIIMTTLAMIFGMVPLALGMGEGSETRAPMAHAIIGGLITSTLLTLFIVPVIYTLLDDLKAKVGRRIAPAVSIAKQ